MTVPPDPQTDAPTPHAEAGGRPAAGPPASRSLGRPAPETGTPAPAPTAPELAPAQPQGPTRGTTHALIHLLGGVLVLGLLAYFMWTPGEWTTRLFAWVLLTIVADEFGGWYGYGGLALGALGYLSPVTPPEQWSVILPLVGGALGGLLLLKHSGGLFVLPFAGVLFAGTLLVAARLGTRLDPELTLPARVEFQRTALVALGLGLLVSAVRQTVDWVLRVRARRRHPVPLPG
ncbi:hypothetical protein [Deinococcus arcticus]|uniref:Uncharacterized protein n=1 Tax=Deinococcus arcticus TaxID=2136176 RepID=A0A2T3WB71_9DEIO|nr:hypothetical protein [Deinococcus arcticus]PTA69054.1 hypothetical protein C8263_04490 [Deinococcus arcticus]